MKNQKTGKTISGPALEIIRKMIKGQKVSQEESGLSVREFGELINLLENNK
jgi:thymidylate synthase (FAD)